MTIQELADQFPEVRRLLTRLERHEKNNCYPPGHFYSPVFSIEDLMKREDQIWKGTSMKHLPGIDLNVTEQIQLARSLEVFYPEMPFGKGIEGIRYVFQNSFYSYTDAIILYAMMLHFRPRRIIEVGSGFSSAVMLDTKEHFDLGTQLYFIEPHPERLIELLKKGDSQQCHLLEKEVQQVEPAFFQTLQKNDFLFIDSSHVVKTGGDLNSILFDIIPALEKGVLIHFHDIFYPFEYPKNWIQSGRNWNENYFLRAFLMYNQAFKIRFFSRYLHANYAEAFENMPLCYENPGGNLWLEKMN